MEEYDGVKVRKLPDGPAKLTGKTRYRDWDLHPENIDPDRYLPGSKKHKEAMKRQDSHRGLWKLRQ